MTDDKFCSVYGLQFKAGRFFNIADTSAVSESLPEGQRFPKSVVNEELVKELGFESSEAALGKKVLDRNEWMACRNSGSRSRF